MTLAITVYVPEGIVMATDSRQIVKIEGKTSEGREFKVETVASDSVTKTFLLEQQGVGISAFGKNILDGIPIAGHIKNFIEEKLTVSDDVESIPRKLIDYFRGLFPDAPTGFHVAGYKKAGRISVPYVYYCHVAENTIQRRNIRTDGSIAYGAAWSGEIDVLTSIINPVVFKDETGQEKIIRQPPPIIWDALTLQDAIDFAIYAIRTTIDTMRFQARPKTVGGSIDVLVLTPEEVKWIQRKELHP